MLMSRRFPFWDVEKTMNEMSRLFDAFDGPMSLRSMPRGTFPPMNIYEKDENVILTAEIPGVKTEDIELNVLENSLTLTAKRDSEQNGGKRFYRRERPFGSFSRTVSLAEKVDPDNVNAEYNDGVLTVTMPKKKKTKPRSISVKTK